MERREEKQMLSTQDIELERERYELKTRDDIALEKRQETEHHKVQIQHLKEKLNEYVTIKRDQLKLSTEGVERLHVVLGQMLRSLNEQKENVAGYKEVLEREKETLNALLYDTQQQRVQLENQWNQMINLEQWNVITLEAEQQQEKLVLDMRKQKMVKDEVDLELIGHDIQKQRQILQQDKQQIQEQREELERTVVELFKKVEETNNLFDVINKDKSKIKELNLCLKTRGDKLKVLMNMIALKPQRLESESPEFHTQTQNLELSRKRIQETQEELQDLMKNAITMKEQVQVSISGIQKDKDQMISMKKDIEIDREKLSYEKERLKRERSEFKMRQDELLNKLKSTANLRLTLQGVKDEVWEHTKETIGRLNKTHEDAQLLCISLENKLSTVGEKMNRITPYKELFEREKINLRSIISSMSNQREMMEYQWKKMVDLDKEDLNKVKAELKLDRQNLEGVAGKIGKDKVGLELMMSDIQKQRAILQKEQRDIKEEREQMKITKTQLDLKVDDAKSCWAEIHKEKAKLKDLSVSVQRKQQRLQDIMNMLALKQQDTQRRGQMLHTQTQTLQSKRIQVQKEKEEIEVLMSTANKMKEWLKAAMASVHKEKEPVDYSRMERREEKQMLSTQDIELERERYELKTRDDIALEKRQETEHHKVQIQHLKEKLNEYVTIKRDQLKLSTEGVERLHVVLGQMLRSLNEQKENVAGYKEVLEREKETLNALLYDTQQQRVQLENQWNQMINLEQWNVITLEAEQQQEKLVLDMRKQKMVKDEVDLELIGHDIQKQRQILQQDKQQIQEQREELERTVVELFKKVEETNNLFDVINKDKSKIKELNLCLKTRGDKLKVLMNMIALKPQRLESESPEFHTQTQNLQLSRKRIQETQEELQDLMKNAITMKEQVQVSISSIQKDKDQMISMKKDIEIDREKLSYEKERLKRERSEFKMRQDELLNKLKSTANLRLTLQGVKDEVWEHTKETIGRLNKTHEDAQLLCISLENKLSTVGEKMNRITPYKELFEREKINLRSIISSMSNQREMMEYQWKKMVDLDKGESYTINIPTIHSHQKVEDLPIHVTQVTKMLSSLKQRMTYLNQITIEQFKKNTERLDRKSQSLIDFLHLLQSSCKFHLNRCNVSSYLSRAQRQKLHFTPRLCEKATQTAGVCDQKVEDMKENLSPFKISKSEREFQKPFEKSNVFETGQQLISNDLKNVGNKIKSNREWPTPEFKEVIDVQRKKPATTSRFLTKTEKFTKWEKGNSLQRLWKDTIMEHKEINLMKHRGQEIRKRLEKRLKEIIHFFNITLSQKEKTFANSSLGSGMDTSTQSDLESDTEIGNRKYLDLQQLKFHILREIERHHFKTLVSCEKCNQTSQNDVIPAKVKEMQTSSEMKEERDEAGGEENEAVPATSSRLFCLLQHYCSPCCCYCCTCRKQTCTKTNRNIDT
ncbi:uncharacterized protein V3H82_021090 [Fundulus diaphanus]